MKLESLHFRLMRMLMWLMMAYALIIGIWTEGLVAVVFFWFFIFLDFMTWKTQKEAMRR